MRKLSAFLAWLAVSVTGCTHDPALTSSTQIPESTCVAGASIDLERYMGRWYVIAETPFLTERDYVGNYDEWTLRRDGKIDDKYLGRRYGFDQPVTGSDLVARVMPGTGNAKWRVELIWPFEVVIATAYVDPEYRYTIRCMVDANMIWILSRTPEMDEATYADMLARVRRMGADVGSIRRVPQRLEQIGTPGYE